MNRASLALIVALAAGLSTQATAQTLKTVKDRGMLSCGVSQGLPGFSAPDDKGNWAGLDVDICRAIAAAIFNDAAKVKFVPLSAKDRFTALQSGEIDVLSRNTTWTLSRDTSLGANFTGVTYYDGQGFLVKKSLKVNSALELNSASDASRHRASAYMAACRHRPCRQNRAWRISSQARGRRPSGLCHRRVRHAGRGGNRCFYRCRGA